MRTLLSRYDLAEFQAQTHAADMVDILAAFAWDVTKPDDFRRQCANDVLDRAYGKPTMKAHFEMVDPSADAGDGSTVGQTIKAACAAAQDFQDLDELVRRKVPQDQWPERLRKLAGDAIAYYSEESG